MTGSGGHSGWPMRSARRRRTGTGWASALRRRRSEKVEPPSTLSQPGALAERQVEKELIGELANVPGERGIFTKMVDAGLEHSDDTVRDALYPAGEDAELAGQELKATARARYSQQTPSPALHHPERQSSPEHADP